METRKETLSSAVSILNRPSWGKRFSSIFKLDNIFILAVMLGAVFFRQNHSVAQDAVYSVPDKHFFFHRLNVNIAGPLQNGVL